MLALLRSEANHRGIPSCVLTFEPHPRDYFASVHQRTQAAPARIGTLRDKLSELQRCGVEQTIVLDFDAMRAAQSAEQFVMDVLVQGLGARYVLVGDDFRFGAQRAGDYTLLDQMGLAHSIDVARMNSYEVHGLRVSSSAVRQALGRGHMHDAAALLGRPYSISGHVVHGRQLGRQLGASTPDAGDGFRTLNLRFRHAKPAASGIFVVQVHGLADQPIQGVANLGVRPSLDASDVNGGQVLLETHCFDWPSHLDLEAGYGRIIQVDLLHHLHDERAYPSLQALQEGIAQDCLNARDYFAQLRQGA